MRSDFRIRYLWTRWGVWLDDKLRNSRVAWEASAWYLAGRYFLKGGPPELRLQFLANAYRRATSAFLRGRLERLLTPWLSVSHADIWRKRKIGWARYQPDVADRELNKSLILKAPTLVEKGVLYVSFEVNWLRLLERCDVRRLLTDYFFVGASSWSPPDFLAQWALAHLGRDPVFVQVSNPADVALYRRLDHHVCPLPLMASDWINPRFYSPRPPEARDIDILMVAGWSKVKRHWLLFRALRKMRADLRVVLIGQNADGRSADDVFAEAKAFGVGSRIEIIRDAPIELVTDYQCRSKASVLLSHREGSCVAVAESLFADTPVAMLHDAHVGSRAYINGETGVLLRRESLDVQLEKLLEERARYAPRAWALGHVTCFESSGKLNSILRAYSEKHGLPWSRDIKPLCWRPDPTYADPEDRGAMAHAYEELRERHGVTISGHAWQPRVAAGKPW